MLDLLSCLFAASYDVTARHSLRVGETAAYVAFFGVLLGLVLGDARARRATVRRADHRAQGGGSVTGVA